MITFKSVAVTSLLLFATQLQAQVSIPTEDISLSFAGALPVNIRLGQASSRTVTPTPFKIDDLAGYSDKQLWFCMDPSQGIYWQGNDYSGQTDVYNSPTHNPSSFNNWQTGAANGGLTTAKIQDLANLFTAYESFQYSQFGSVSLQFAVWEIVNEHNSGPYSLLSPINSSSFSISAASSSSSYTTAYNSIFNTAQNMLAQLNTWGSGSVHGNANYMTYLIDGKSDIDSRSGSTRTEWVQVQDLLGWAPPIPESGNFAMGALGLLGVAVIAKLRSRKAKTQALLTV